ncbi:GerMN domain-containing protein [Neomoorella mulderi]|uniref:Spore germination protein GerM n=1 Tax=Moorella mulderi DSM 14980 TaxID=1122241 RepID=A0A151AW93_9FIRM|nr:GerMN domain-containing protein [Moorella mulderi]KYH31881.1 spore germination protein GerM [Moorella mulderi DSM 14980]
MRAGRYLAVAVSLLLVVALASGCGFIDGLTGKSRSQVQVQLPPPETSTPATGAEEKKESTKTTQVVLYFSDPTGNYLVAEQRTLPLVEGIARAAIEELIKGPGPGSQLLPTIPRGTVLKDINIRPDGLARVDFSKELVANHSGGSLGESLTVYSIVNTLTQFPTVKQVQFLVDGQFVKTIAGHVDVSTAMSRNESLIKKEAQ